MALFDVSKYVKSEAEQFSDWFENYLGYCYGSGEGPILNTLRTFFALGEIIPGNKRYATDKLITAFGEPLTWFLINFLANHGMIEYGSSPRNGWLTRKGLLLEAYFKKYTNDELEQILQSISDKVSDGSYVRCFKDFCQCDSSKKNLKCNSLWGTKGEV